jgi:aerobic carbon-monoxide dehydrogenase medium subunit
MPAPGATLPPFELHRPATLDDAVDLLVRLGPEAHVYAGGTELLLVLRSRLADARHLVDVKQLPGLDGIGRGGDLLRIGATATHARVGASPEVAASAPALARAASLLGNVRVRSTGTLGGNLCFAEPHGDPGTVLLAHGASLGLHGPAGPRSLPLEEFTLGVLDTAREPGEILTHVDVPHRSWTGSAYLRFATLERPTAGVCVLLDADEGRVREARIAVGSVEPRPRRLPGAEAAAAGLPLDAGDELLDEVGAAAAGEVEPSSDLYGPADYKRALVGTLVARALREAARPGR